MAKPFLPYGRQVIEDDDVAAVARVLRSDMLTTGPEGPALEAEFAEACGAPLAVACNSGTAALHLVAMAIGLGPGSAAIVPSITFLATANAVRLTGAEVVFADVDPETGLMTPATAVAAFARAQQPVKAIFPVHLGGQTVDLPALAALAKSRSAVIVEDACHALGSVYTADGAEHRVGACAHSVASTFSLHPVKTIAAGEGGVVTVRDDALRDRIARLRNHGIVRDGSFTSRDLAYAPSGGPNPWYYEMPEPGYNYRLSDIQAALARSQLGKLARFGEIRRRLAQYYEERLKELSPIIKPVGRVPGNSPVWHLFQVRIDFGSLGLSRAQLIWRLKDRGIGTQVHYVPVHRQPYYAERYPGTALNGADRFYAETLSLPLFAGMTEADVDRVVDALKGLLRVLDRPTRTPIDLDSAFKHDDWRHALSWPLPLPVAREVSRRPLAGLAAVAASSTAEDRQAVLLGGGIVAAFARQILDVAATLEAARTAGIRADAVNSIARALSDDEAARRELIAVMSRPLAGRPVPRAVLRRLGRTAHWSTPMQQVKALLAPDVIAISHNSLLVADASRTDKAVAFEHADQILLKARAGRRDVPHDRSQLADRLVSAMTEGTGLGDSSIERVRGILRPIAAALISGAAGDLAVLSGTRFKARELWSATGGSYASRAVGMAAMAQGLLVRRYEHVGTGCLIADGLGFDTTERAVSSEVFVPTQQLARFAENIRTPSLEPLARLVPGQGDPEFRFTARARPPSSLPRVVYATTILRGQMQYHGALLPDAVYLDWQMHVAEALSALPVEATLKPHPKSRYPGGRNPLSTVGTLSGTAFEDLIPSSDVFIFDFGQTTTFWKGLATSQPVVYLDLGITDFQPEVRAALEKRAVVVPVGYDERNRPQLDHRALAEAIESARPAGEDNPFARWLGGDRPR